VKFAEPFADTLRTVSRLDDADKIGGSDTIFGDAGNDQILGQEAAE
jgi:hypothetical protein